MGSPRPHMAFHSLPQLGLLSWPPAPRGTPPRGMCHQQRPKHDATKLMPFISSCGGCFPSSTQVPPIPHPGSVCPPSFCVICSHLWLLELLHLDVPQTWKCAGKLTANSSWMQECENQIPSLRVDSLLPRGPATLAGYLPFPAPRP